MERRLIIISIGFLFTVPMRSVAQGSIVIVHLRDSTTREGELLSVQDSSITLPGDDLVPAPELGKNYFRRATQTLPNSKIQNVVLQIKVPGNPSYLETITGVTIGIVIGAYVGIEIGRLIIEPSHGFGSIVPGLAALLLGGVLGGELGGTLGGEIVNGSRMKDLTFDPNNYEQRDSLRVYAQDKRK